MLTLSLYSLVIASTVLSAHKQFCLSLRVSGASGRSLLWGKLALPKEHSKAVAAGTAGSRPGHLVATAPMEKPSAKSVVRGPQGVSVIQAEGIESCSDPQGSSVSPVWCLYASLYELCEQ